VSGAGSDERQRDPSNGYEAVATEFARLREASKIGVRVVESWARALPTSAAVLDLGCGSGVPVACCLSDAGHVVYGIDASSSLVAEFRRRLPHARVACERVENSDFFGRRFDAVVAIGLIFLLQADTQVAVIHRMAKALRPGGCVLISAPLQACSWTDALTGRASESLGEERYQSLFEQAGLSRMGEWTDEGGNHYFDLRASEA